MIIMLMKFSSLAASEIIKIKTSHEASDDNYVNLATSSVQLGPFLTWHLQQNDEYNFKFIDDTILENSQLFKGQCNFMPLHCWLPKVT